MHKGCGVKGVIGLPAAGTGACESAKLVIDHFHKFGSAGAIAFGGLIEEDCELVLVHQKRGR